MNCQSWQVSIRVSESEPDDFGMCLGIGPAEFELYFALRVDFKERLSLLNHIPDSTQQAYTGGDVRGRARPFGHAADFPTIDFVDVAVRECCNDSTVWSLGRKFPLALRRDDPGEGLFGSSGIQRLLCGMIAAVLRHRTNDFQKTCGQIE